MEETSMIVSPCVPSIDTSPSLLSISLFVHLLLRLSPIIKYRKRYFCPLDSCTV